MSCRRKIIASHFDETWESTDCKEMCDHCREPFDTRTKDITEHCLSLYKILDEAFKNDVKLTAQMLLDTWYGKSSKIKTKVTKPPLFSTDFASNIVAQLLINDYLQEDFHFTPYSTISYLKKGPKSTLVKDDHRITMMVRGGRKSKVNVSGNDSTKKRSNDNSPSKPSSKHRRIFSIDSDSD